MSASWAGRTPTADEWREILEKHARWLRGESDGARAYLSGANLSRAYLSGAKNSELAIAMTRILPGGELIGWKKCYGGRIVKLSIPADAKRSHAFGRKCRAEYAVVLEITGPKGGNHAEANSLHQNGFVYQVGATVRPDAWEKDWTKCASGIHFYITRAEAEAHS